MAKLGWGDCVWGNAGFVFLFYTSSQNYPQHQKGEEHRKENYFMLEEQGGENLLWQTKN